MIEIITLKIDTFKTSVFSNYIKKQKSAKRYRRERWKCCCHGYQNKSAKWRRPHTIPSNYAEIALKMNDKYSQSNSVT